MEILFRGVLTILGSIFTFWIGEWDLLIQYLLLFILIDYVSGLISAFRNKELSSEVGWFGLLRKVTIFVVIGIAHGIDMLINQYPIDGVQPEIAFPTLRTLIVWGYIINEVISILENISKSGVYLPPPLLKVMEFLKANSEKVNK